MIINLKELKIALFLFSKKIEKNGFFIFVNNFHIFIKYENDTE